MENTKLDSGKMEEAADRKRGGHKKKMFVWMQIFRQSTGKADETNP